MITLLFKHPPVEVEFDPDSVLWRTKNFGWYSPKGFFCSEIGKKLFIKKLSERPASHALLSHLVTNSVSKNLPTFYAIHESNNGDCAHGYYIFMEMVEGITLDKLRGQIELSHCHEILSGILKAVKSISALGYWYADLDMGNVLITSKGGASRVLLIDIDSCMQETLSFTEFARSTERRLNVNERYWSYVVNSFKESGISMDTLLGRSLCQAAVMYFAIDLYFNIKYPDRVFSLKPTDISRLMGIENNQYFSITTRELWHDIHQQFLQTPDKGVAWCHIDRFITTAFGFKQPLIPLPKKGFFSTLSDIFFRK